MLLPRSIRLFRSTFPGVDVLPSADRHGVAHQDTRHALRHALVVEDIDEDPPRTLVLGPDRAGISSSSSCWTASRAPR